MNKAIAGYHMLMILSVVDGNYEVAEGKVIVDFLAKNYQLHIDIEKENQALLEVDKHRIPQHFGQSAREFESVTNEEERIDFLMFAYKLIMAEGKLAMEEEKIFISLAHLWKIDVKPIMNDSVMSQVDQILNY